MAETEVETRDHVRGFWDWLLRKDAHGDRGIANLFDLWNGFGLLLSGLVAAMATASASSLSLGIALPVTGALVGISFAWAGRSSSLLQDHEYAAFVIKYGAPPEGYVYSFQLAILTAIFAVVVAATLASEVYIGSTGTLLLDETINRFLLLGFSWIAARESWGVISFSNKLAIQFYKVRGATAENEGRGADRE